MRHVEPRWGPAGASSPPPPRHLTSPPRPARSAAELQRSRGHTSRGCGAFSFALVRLVLIKTDAPRPSSRPLSTAHRRRRARSGRSRSFWRPSTVDRHAQLGRRRLQVDERSARRAFAVDGDRKSAPSHEARARAQASVAAEAWLSAVPKASTSVPELPEADMRARAASNAVCGQSWTDAEADLGRRALRHAMRGASNLARDLSRGGARRRACQHSPAVAGRALEVVRW